MVFKNSDFPLLPLSQPMTVSLPPTSLYMRSLALQWCQTEQLRICHRCGQPPFHWNMSRYTASSDSHRSAPTTSTWPLTTLCKLTSGIWKEIFSVFLNGQRRYLLQNHSFIGGLVTCLSNLFGEEHNFHFPGRKLTSIGSLWNASLGWGLKLEILGWIRSGKLRILFCHTGSN